MEGVLTVCEVSYGKKDLKVVVPNDCLTTSDKGNTFFPSLCPFDGKFFKKKKTVLDQI